MTNLEKYFIPLEETEAAGLLAEWAWLLGRPLSPVCFSVFGDWFLRDAEGRIHWLDSAFGELSLVAASEAEFRRKLETPELRDEWLMAGLADVAFERGLKPQEGECLGFKAPVTLGAELTVENLQKFSVGVHQTLHSQLHRQLRGKPAGYKVTGFVLGDRDGER